LAGRPPYKPFGRFRDHWRPDDALPKSEAAQKAKLRPATAAMLALARTMQIIAGKDLMDDPEMMTGAIDLESRVWKPTAKDFDDAALAIQAFRWQQKALEAIKLVLSELPPGYHQSPPLAPLAPV
jgi:hypothetical protein